MKRLYLLLVFMCLSVTTVFADGKYSLTELSMEINFNENWAVADRNADSNNEVLKLFAMDLKSLNQMFEQTNMYLLAYNPQDMMQVEISEKTAVTENDFNLYTDEAILNAFSPEVFGTDEMVEFVPGSIRVLSAGKTKFISFEERFKNVDGLRIMEYYTVAGGKGIFVSVRNYENEFSAQKKQKADEIISSIVFSNIADNQQILEAAKVQGFELPAADMYTVETVDGAEMQAASTEEPTQAPQGMKSVLPEESPSTTVKPTEEPTPFPLAEAEETEKSDEQDNEQEKEQNIVLTWIIIVSVIVLVGAAFVTAYKREKRNNKN